MARFKLMNEQDANHQLGLQSTNEKDATAETFEVLMWQLIEVSDKDAETDMAFDDVPSDKELEENFCENDCPKETSCKRDEYKGCPDHPSSKTGDNEKDKSDDAETVSLIASGYDWECPNCGRENMEMEYSAIVACRECYKGFKADLPDYPSTE